MQRYSYRYALFSASGFTGNAVDMAMAHQISLIDLRAPGFSDLLDLVRDSVRALFGGTRARNARVNHTTIRARTRRVLGTWPLEVPYDLPDDVQAFLPDEVFEPDDLPGEGETGASGFTPRARDLNAFEERLKEGAAALHEFFLGVPNGPFLLLLRADDPTAFLAFARAHPSHDVHITWDWETENADEWQVSPVDGSDEYRLRFALPAALADWIFARAERAESLAARAKRQYLSRISVYRHEDGRDEVFTLTYQPQEASARRRHGSRRRR